MTGDRAVAYVAAFALVAAFVTDTSVDKQALVVAVAVYLATIFSVAVMGAFAIVTWEAFVQPALLGLARLFRKVRHAL